MLTVSHKLLHAVLSTTINCSPNYNIEEKDTMDTLLRIERLAAQWFDRKAGRDFLPETETTKQVRLDKSTSIIIQLWAIEG